MLYYRGLFFESDTQLEEAKKLLKENGLFFSEETIYDQFYMEEAEAELGNLLEEFTDKDIEEVATALCENGDSVINSDVVSEITIQWAKSKGYEI